MGKVNIILVILLLITAGCGGNKQSGNESDALITVDVTASYPKKELILQDFMDVEYIPLETSNNFLCQGSVLAIGKDIMLVKNSKNDGDIFIFNRNGKGLRKINHLGKSGEEYINITSIVLDENTNEVFVNDHMANRILVYDLDGKFKRSFNHKEGAWYVEVFNYDRDNLICYDSSKYLRDSEERGDQSFFAIISKQDGSITREIEIPFKKKIPTGMMLTDAKSIQIAKIRYSPIIPHHGNWILTEPSADTIFRFLPDYSMTPFIARTPSIQSMSPEVFLFPGILTDRYYFMESVKKEYDFTTNKGFPKTHLVYDKQNKVVSECTVYNDDYTNKKIVEMTQPTINDEIAFWQKIDADALLESFDKGDLKGKLKEIAAGLEEESNPVIMLVKYKK